MKILYSIVIGVVIIIIGSYFIWTVFDRLPFTLSLDDRVNSIILFITAVVVVGYTIETYRLRKVGQEDLDNSKKQFGEVKKQTELSLAPMLVVSYERVNNQGSDYNGKLIFRLKNIGKGPAFNVNIHVEGQTKIDCGVNEEFYENLNNIIFNKQGYVNNQFPDNHTEIIPQNKDMERKIINETIMEKLQPTSENHHYKVFIGYENLIKEKYITLLKCGVGKNDYQLEDYRKVIDKESGKYKNYFLV